jgi:alkanesulfonate monooxygenase SsuD/methylene tetrahydromethanopterin reductase-like flavin-dependent oxidoreductase (luciferase family)
VIGLTLPSFVEDPEIPIEIARLAEAAGLDAVFVFDHLWRGREPKRRPAIEPFTLLGAIAPETQRIAIGTLVARATLRPPATLANGFATVQRVSNGRLIAGIGSGDHESKPENVAYGLDFGTMADRIGALHDAVRASSGRGFPVWVGGKTAQVREIVAIADGWNAWGLEADAFASEVRLIREVHPDATLTWGGLARPSEEGARALADRLRPYGQLGAAMTIVGPVDSTNPANVDVLREVRETLSSS